MTTLKDIQQAIAPELTALNEIIAQSLHSHNELMNSIVDNYLKTKGKQLRPMLVLLSGRLFGGINSRVLHAGAAIEMLHNASLIHDDVLDQSRTRRGVATINNVWDNHVAVLVGDFFVSRALSCAISSDNTDTLRVLSQLGADLSLGEIDQENAARNHTITEADYFKIIDQKTASLFTSCVEVGGLAAGATREQLEPMMRYARLLGQCFQIKDDTFDYFHNPVIGKPTGNDLREGKVTLPLIYALSLPQAPGRDAMAATLAKTELSTEEINSLIEFAKQNGGIDYAYATMERLRQEAERELDNYPSCDTTDALKLIFRYIIDRKK